MQKFVWRKRGCGYLLSIAFFLFPSSGALAEKSFATEVSTIQEAEDYLSINPHYSWQLLSEMSEYNHLPIKQQLRLFLTKFRVAMTLKNTSDMEDALEEVARYQTHPLFHEKRVSTLSSLGLYFRFNYKYEAAKASYLCALGYVEKPKLPLSLINSVAIIARQRGQLDLAERIYRRTIPIADSENLTANRSSLRNNLGAVFMDRGNFNEATEYFYQALQISQKNLRRKSYLLNSLNLMFSSLVSGDFLYFQRLDEPVKRLLASHSEDDFSNAYYLWVSALYKIKTSGTLTDVEKNRLENVLHHVTNPKLTQLLVMHVAPQAGLQIELPPKPNKAYIDLKAIKSEEYWFNLFPQCEWEKLQEIMPGGIWEYLSPFYSIEKN